MLFVKDDVLVVAQMEGYIDLVHFPENNRAIVTHSLRVEEAGNINCMSLGAGEGEFMIASQKGLFSCRVTPDKTFQLISAVSEYNNFYVVNVSAVGE